MSRAFVILFNILARPDEQIEKYFLSSVRTGVAHLYFLSLGISSKYFKTTQINNPQIQPIQGSAHILSFYSGLHPGLFILRPFRSCCKCKSLFIIYTLRFKKNRLTTLRPQRTAHGFLLTAQTPSPHRHLHSIHFRLIYLISRLQKQSKRWQYHPVRLSRSVMFFLHNRLAVHLL
jgi:hypothetical protein